MHEKSCREHSHIGACNEAVSKVNVAKDEKKDEHRRDRDDGAK